MLEEDYEFLKQFENNFRTAIHSNYTRNIVESNLKKMVAIYEKEIGKPYKLCFHCGTVIVNFLKDLGAIYFKVQEGIEDNMKIKYLDETVTNKANEGRQKEVKGVGRKTKTTKTTK